MMYGPPSMFRKLAEQKKAAAKQDEKKKTEEEEKQQQHSSPSPPPGPPAPVQTTTAGPPSVPYGPPPSANPPSMPYSSLQEDDVERVQLIAAIALRREQLHLRARLDSNEFVHSSRAELEQHYHYFDEQLEDTGCRQLVDGKSSNELDALNESSVDSLGRI
jgi:hypothetical protein